MRGKNLGFGDYLILHIRLLYNNVLVMVKAGGGLSAPIPVTRGVRPGCLLSGQLYSLMIEPLLCRLRRVFKRIAIPSTNDN